MTAKRVLVVFGEIPERVSLLVLSVPETMLDVLRTWHGKYINMVGTSDSIAEEINRFFWDKEGGFRHKEDVRTELLADQHFDLIIHTGILL